MTFISCMHAGGIQNSILHLKNKLAEDGPTNVTVQHHKE